MACAALAGGADVKAFFVRKDAKEHGLQRRIEGPLLEPGDRCLIVEDVVTTGGSTMQALEALREAGRVVGVVSVLDRLAGGASASEARPSALRRLTTIDDVYPDRPDRGVATAATEAAAAITYRRGDWVELAESVPPAAIVTFDRVIQRYPDLELAGLSVERARRLYGLVYPRDTYREARPRRAEPHPALAPKAGLRLCPSGRPDRAGCSRERSQPLLLSKRRTCVAG